MVDNGLCLAFFTPLVAATRCQEGVDNHALPIESMSHAPVHERLTGVASSLVIISRRRRLDSVLNLKLPNLTHALQWCCTENLDLAFQFAMRMNCIIGELFQEDCEKASSLMPDTHHKVDLESAGEVYTKSTSGTQICLRSSAQESPNPCGRPQASPVFRLARLHT